MTELRRRRRLLLPAALASAAGLSLAVLAPAGPAGAAGERSEQQLSHGFRKAVTVQGIREHQAAFQSHSDAHGGNRVAGGPGYEASAEYVLAKLRAAGYNATAQEFQFAFNEDQTPPVLAQVSPDSVSYVDGVDFASMTFSPNGDVTADVWAVDLVLPPTTTSSSTSGCEAADFAGFPAGGIALVQRGACTFAAKAAHAAAAGAVAVIIFNEGQAGRTGVLGGTLGDVQTHSLPVVGTSFAVGEDLANLVQNGVTGSRARVRVDRLNETRTTRNVFAETSGGDPNNVVVVGAHLDSVSRGAGINDNGSGSAGILEIAEVLASQQRDVRNKVRFAWWGAEELGLLGSRHYVSNLTAAQQDAIALNLNFDMIGSPNFVRFIYDGDNSAFPASPPAVADGPDGSGEIERVFRDYFGAMSLASAETPFNGRSDYGPFIAVGIPAGGLFTGAEGVKTAAQADLFGGTAGQAYDPCYHLACDTLANTSLTGLDQMADAAAHAVLHFSRRDLARQPLVDPVPPPTSSGSGGGGGLHDDHEREQVES